MGKHTPGPWRIGDAAHTVFGPPNGNPSPEIVATCIKRNNIRLIAAAPELLDACLAALSILTEGEAAFGSVIDYEAQLKKDIKQLKQAIAKAEGK